MATLTQTAAPVKPARKPRPRPARSIQLVIPPAGGTGVVRITVGKASTDYALRGILSQLSGRAFELAKVGPDAGGEVYHVLLTGHANYDTCTCPGYAAHSHCKHRDGLAALVAAGRL
jgi:hypothetical protein